MAPWMFNVVDWWRGRRSEKRDTTPWDLRSRDSNVHRTEKQQETQGCFHISGTNTILCVCTYLMMGHITWSHIALFIA